MNDLWPPAIAVSLGALLGAATVAGFASAADALPDPPPPATVPYAWRVDASDVTWPASDDSDRNAETVAASNAGVEAVTTVVMQPTPPQTWARGLPCRGCGPSRHPVYDDENSDYRWYGHIWEQQY